MATGQLVNEKKPTGSASIPEEVAWAKEINEQINEKVEVLDIDDDNELNIDTGGTGDSALVISSEGEVDTQGMCKSHSRTLPIQTYVASHAGSKVTGLKPPGSQKST